MKIYLVYNGDGWLSKDSLNLVAVCTSKESAIEIVKQDAEKNYNLAWRDNIAEDYQNDDEIYMEDVIEEIDQYNQVTALGWGYTIDTVETDTIL